jgi:hypothetical protein
VAGRAGKRTPLRPAAVAVHHACHVPRHRTGGPVVAALSFAVVRLVRLLLGRGAGTRDAAVPPVRPRPVWSDTVSRTALGHARPVLPRPCPRPTGAFSFGESDSVKTAGRANE